MSKAVFTTKVNPTYDDLPEHHYHFPKMYLRAVEQTVGDWIVYYEPSRTSGNRSSRGGRQSYFATARVVSLKKDPDREDHFYAFVADYLEFDNPVPFKEGDYYYESRLKREDGKTNKGAFGRSVRPIEEREYETISLVGFNELVSDDRFVREPRVPHDIEPMVIDRPILRQVINRPFRDAAFSRQVKSAYNHTCAVTGIQLINGGGRSEVQAAHIRPVDKQGPDSVRNGLALSGTVHWMFDRGLISVDDDYSILIARANIPDPLVSIFNSDRHLSVPANSIHTPHPQFLKYHRENVFKG